MPLSTSWQSTPGRIWNFENFLKNLMYEVLSSYSTFSLTVFRRQPLDCFFLKSVLPGMQILRFTEASRVCVSDLTQGLWSAFMIISTNSCCNCLQIMSVQEGLSFLLPNASGSPLDTRKISWGEKEANHSSPFPVSFFLYSSLLHFYDIAITLIYMKHFDLSLPVVLRHFVGFLQNFPLLGH